LGLPVYHELVGKFGEYLRLDEAGRVLDKARMSSGYSSLQPVVVPLHAERGLGLMRRSGSSPPRVLAVETRDAGSSWSAMTPTPLANPDAAVAAIRMTSGELLMAFNDSERDRSNLSLALSDDGGDRWETVRVLEPPESVGDSPARFAYPWLLETTDGELHLFYTWNRDRIVHVRFNHAWLLGIR
jgi:predicted neuraminidase